MGMNMNKELMEAYKECIDFLHKKKKRIPYKALDVCLYCASQYIELAERINNDIKGLDYE